MVGVRGHNTYGSKRRGVSHNRSLPPSVRGSKHPVPIKSSGTAQVQPEIRMPMVIGLAPSKMPIGSLRTTRITSPSSGRSPRFVRGVPVRQNDVKSVCTGIWRGSPSVVSTRRKRRRDWNPERCSPGGKARVDNTFTEPLARQPLRAVEQRQDHCCSDVFAFVTVLWGTSSKHCLDALVLGMSLRQVRTQHDMVLLHTSDVPSCWLQVLQRFWELRLVRHLESRGLYNGGSGGRFEHVFTKLHVFNLTDYDKVVLLDGDMILLKNVDHLFKREAPAALRRHAGADFGDDERINGEDFWNHRGELSNGINAGVILLEPSRADFQIMCKEISDEGHCEHSVSGMPEQDYLTRYFVDRWRSLGVQYNFQLHQVAFTNRRRLETCTRLVTEYEDIFIVHFSGKVGPRDFLLANECYKMSSLKCAEYLVQIYKPLMGRQGSGRLGPYPIEAQLRSFTYSAVASWFELWTRLLQECPNLEEIVTAHRQAATGELRMVLSTGSRQTRTKGRPGKGRPGVRSGPVS